MEATPTPAPSFPKSFWAQCLLRSAALVALLTLFPYAVVWGWLAQAPAAVGMGLSVLAKAVIEHPVVSFWVGALPFSFSVCCLMKLEKSEGATPRWIWPVTVASTVGLTLWILIHIFQLSANKAQANWAAESVTLLEERLDYRSRKSRALLTSCGQDAVTAKVISTQTDGRQIFNCERVENQSNTLQIRALSAVDLNDLTSCLSTEERSGFNGWQTVCVEDSPTWSNVYNPDQDTLVQTVSGLSRGACKRFYRQLSQGQVERLGGPLNILINGKPGDETQCTNAWNNTVGLKQSAEWVGWVEKGEKKA
jgi:hypothetical protein